VNAAAFGAAPSRNGILVRHVLLGCVDAKPAALGVPVLIRRNLMQQLDIQSLGAKEQRAFATSFMPAKSQRGMRNLVLATFVAFVAVAVFSIFGIERVPIAAMAVFIVLVLVSEKISYFREIRAYRSLVRGLARRIEQLEVPGPKSAQAFSPQATGARQGSGNA
jgi:hypothetical protein